MLKSCLFSVAALFSVVAGAAQSHIQVSDAQVREFLPGAPSSVAYLSIQNHGDKARVLTGATLEKLDRVEIHKHSHSDGMMKMVKVEQVEVAPHGEKVFQPGGYHLMLFSPTEKLTAGQKLKLTLHFKNGEAVETQAKVVSLAQQVEQEKSSHHQH